MSDKPKCPVFGCTIPRGIPHEHPAGVSAVMRDPVAPLTADERAELESFRREALLRESERSHHAYLQARAMQNTYPFGIGQVHGNAYANEQLARNKRREALLDIAAMNPPPSFILKDEAQDAITYGLGASLDFKHIPTGDVYVVPADAPMVPGRKLTEALLEAGRQTYDQNKILAARICNDLTVKAVTEELYPGRGNRFEGLGVVFDQAPAPRRSLVSTTARVAFWIVLAATVAIGIFAGVKS